MTGLNDRPAGWFRTMETDFAHERFGFPADPMKGDTWTAPDGSGWAYQLNTQYWDITKYSPAESDPLAAYLDDIMCSRAHASTGKEAADHIRDVLGYRQSYIPRSKPIGVLDVERFTVSCYFLASREAAASAALDRDETWTVGGSDD